MRKNLFLISVLFLLVISTIALAAIDYRSARPTLWDSIYKNILKPVFFDLGSEKASTVDMVIFLKIAFGVLLFGLLWAISSVVLHAFPSNSRLAIAAIVSLISVVLIPPKILLSTAQTYGLVFFSVLLGVPIAGGAWLMFTHFREKTRAHYAAKALICFILAVLIGQFADLQFGFGPSWQALEDVWRAGETRTSDGRVVYLVAGVADAAGGFLFFAALWFTICTIWPGIPNAGPGTSPHSFGRGWFGNRFMLPHGSRQAQALQGTGLALVNMINAHASARDLPGIQGDLGSINQITQDLSVVVTTISVDVAGVTDPARQARLQAAFNPLQAAEAAVRTEVSGLQRHAAILAAPAPPANAWPTLQAHALALQNHFNTAIRHVEQIARILSQP